MEVPRVDPHVPNPYLTQDRLSSVTHDTIIASRINQTTQANKRRQQEEPLSTGELVYLSTANLNLPKGRALKLTPRFIGPYQITSANPKTSNYTLELPPELVKRRIHPVFHISRLRKHIANDDERFPKRETLPFYDFGTDPETEWVVDEIVDHRWKGKVLEFRVSWMYGDKTWETLDNCQELSALDEYLAITGVKEPRDLSRENPSRL